MDSKEFERLATKTNERREQEGHKPQGSKSRSPQLTLCELLLFQLRDAIALRIEIEAKWPRDQRYLAAGHPDIEIACDHIVPPFIWHPVWIAVDAQVKSISLALAEEMHKRTADKLPHRWGGPEEPTLDEKLEALRKRWHDLLHTETKK
jgi:hypothetical protein